MKERPILMNGEMVRAVLAGLKTQTRRIVKPQPAYPDSFLYMQPRVIGGEVHWFVHGASAAATVWRCPFGAPGDRLWVRETIELRHLEGSNFPTPVYQADGSHVMDDGKRASNHQFMRRKVHPSIHMPRWASRITLEITGVRVERLNEISEADALAEGVQPLGLTAEDIEDLKTSDSHPDIKSLAEALGPGEFSPFVEFSELWESIYGPGSWASNPWVWVVEFRRRK